MCGIAGIIGTFPRPDLSALGGRLQNSLAHRGPDDSGLFVAPDKRVLFVHTRLAILDLSPAGHQPMVVSKVGSSQLAVGGLVRVGVPPAVDGVPPGTTALLPGVPADHPRLAIVFNGEIYNFRELRAELEAKGHVFSTQTDTEVILHLYAEEGTACVERLRGMFAIALWNAEDGSVFLARDPLGIKQLYLAEIEGGLAFASELRPLVKAGLVAPEVDPLAVQAFFRHGSVPEPMSPLRGTRLLPAGHALEWRDGVVREWKWWSPTFPLAVDVSSEEAGRRTRAALQDSVRAHLVSDVPVGVFLSGGLDSTAIAALVRKSGHAALRTFSISFDEADFDEGGPARRTAEHFGAEHHDWRLQEAEGRALIDDFLGSLDRPSVDGFNTFCVSKFARQHGCKVVLSGLGGDEVFGGYGNFQRVPQLVQAHRRLGRLGLRRLAAGILGKSRSPVRRRLGEFLAGTGTTDAAYTACRSLFTEEEAKRLAEHLVGTTDVPGRVGVPPAVPGVPPGTSPAPPQPETLPNAVSLLELTRYMRSQLLRDSDVMSMRWGLELRVPFVDRTLFEAVRDIPASVRLAKGKQLLADAVPEIPEWIRNRPKKGFMFPFQKWLGGGWESVVRESLAGCPVEMPNWYQRWAVFVFRQWQAQIVCDAKEAHAKAPSREESLSA